MIADRLTYGRQAPFQASKRERKRGRDLAWSLRGMPAPPWVVENWPGSTTIQSVRCKGIREGKPVDETRYWQPCDIRGLLALVDWREPAQALSSA